MTKTLRILKLTLCLVVAVLFLTLVGNLWFEEQDVTELSQLDVNQSQVSKAQKKRNNILHHPKTQEELWIVISSDYIVRSLGYLDKRNKNSVTVRLISMRDKRTPLPKVFMALHYSDSKPSLCFKTTLDYGARGGEDAYEVYLVRTPSLKPDQYESLSHVTIATRKHCKKASDVIPIQTIEPQQFQYNFGMCLHKGIGPDFEPKVLLDWVKLNVALGAELITIYLQTGAEGVYDILLPYINKGIVEILDWKLEPEFTNGGSHHYGQTGIQVECVWRNMYRVRYLGMDDVDEFFIPLKHNSIPNMLTHIETLHKSAKPVASFVFTSTQVKDNGAILPVVKQALSSCPELQLDSLPPYYKRSRICIHRGDFVKKMILRPDAVNIPWVHFLISHRDEDFTRQYAVPEDVGLSYHYRPNWEGFGNCSTPETQTLAVEKFFHKITQC